MIPALPILATVSGAYLTIFRNAGTLIRATLVPGLVLFVIQGFQNFSSSSILLSLLFWSMSLPFVALIAIACHRVVLLGPESLNNAWSLYWTDRESAFFIWLLIFGTCLYLATWAFNVVFLMLPNSLLGIRVPWFGLLLSYGALTYFEGRFGMVLPATALGERMFLSNSWHLTAGNGPKIAIALLLPVVIFYCGYYLVATRLLAMTSSAVFFGAIVFAIITFAVEIAVLSLCYQFLTNTARDADVV